ncbi:MAG: hypothetical protein Q9170_006035 [Blastenia crenularia]
MAKRISPKPNVLHARGRLRRFERTGVEMRHGSLSIARFLYLLQAGQVIVLLVVVLNKDEHGRSAFQATHARRFSSDNVWRRAGEVAATWFLDPLHEIPGINQDSTLTVSPPKDLGPPICGSEGTEVPPWQCDGALEKGFQQDGDRRWLAGTLA